MNYTPLRNNCKKFWWVAQSFCCVDGNFNDLLIYFTV